MAKWAGKFWRYQVVRIKERRGTFYAICEVHLDAKDKLVAWTDAEIFVMGETPRDLERSLVLMLHAAMRWAPVDYKSLKAGMTFKRVLGVA